MSGTVTLPSRSFPAIHGQPVPSLPAPIPGGQAGAAPLPSRLTTWVTPGVKSRVVPGGAHGPVPAHVTPVPAVAPFPAGQNSGWSIGSYTGVPIMWLRRFFTNDAGVNMFIAQDQAVTSRTGNQTAGPGTKPSSPIPTSVKRTTGGGYQREYNVDNQLFIQLVTRAHPWPIQKPVQRMVRRQVGFQPRTNSPYQYQLTRMQAASSYGQTTNTLLAGALSNLLPPTDASNPASSSSVYGGSY
jgi:hypothetical protein